MTNDGEVIMFACPLEQQKRTCEPFDDLRAHDFQAWQEFEDGCGGTTVCIRCGISAMSHSMRYGP